MQRQRELQPFSGQEIIIIQRKNLGKMRNKPSREREREGRERERLRGKKITVSQTVVLGRLCTVHLLSV